MASPFAFFDSAQVYPIHWVSGESQGHYDTTSNIWTAPTLVDTVITGHFASFGSSERGRFESDWKPTSLGVIEAGVQRFFTSAALAKGDIVEKWLDSGGTKKTRYRVLATVKTQGLMTAKLGVTLRREFHLKEEPA